jgi:hypothetical protein
MIHLEVEGSIHILNYSITIKGRPNSVTAIKRDDAIRTALPILQRSQEDKQATR